MRRRDLLLAAGAASLARPAISAPAQTLRIMPQAVLNTIDPVWTSAQIARNMGFMVFETLWGRDAAQNPKFQMLDGAAMDEDGRRWTLRLREQQRFHDGTPVLGRDCVASLRRWMKRDASGAALAALTDELSSPDDRTIVFRLKRGFPHLPELLSKFVAPALMMPERLALTDPFKQIPEAIGSGPFRWVADEHVLGSRAVFAKNEAYVSRQEQPDWTAGGRPVYVDRVEWHMIPDAGTAANALVTGEIDWIEIPLPDLIPMLRQSRGVKVGNLDPYGQIMALRVNHLTYPTSDLGVRRAMMAAIDQKEVMTAIMGGDPTNWTAPVGFLATGKKEVDQAGIENVRGRKSKAEVQAMLDKAGYKGERMVLLHATEHTFFNPASLVVSQQLRDAGFNIDDQAMDWATVQSRRNNRGPLTEGGWSMFPTVTPMPEYTSPLIATFIRSNGKDAFFGWPSDPEIERIFDAWIGATDPAEQTRLERAYELQAFQSLPFIPLGRYVQSSAWRENITGILKGPSVVFWNVKKG